ncbi:MAG: aldo/keto reductase [Bacillota bacterium]
MRRREFIKAVAAMAAVGLETGIRAAEPQGMPRRTLGKTGVEVSALALGGVIGMQLPPSKDHDPTAIAEAALNLGITYFDTAPSYNNGQSESNYGQVLARRRKEVFQNSKTGERTYDGTMRSVEQSLKRRAPITWTCFKSMAFRPRKTWTPGASPPVSTPHC